MNAEIALNYVETVFNGGDVSRIGDFVADDVVDHDAPAGLPAGIAGQRLKIGAFRTAFPDLQITYEFQVADGDMVAGRFRLKGTHSGPFGELEATGNSVDVIGHDFLRFADGKITDHWLSIDMMGLMQQLGN